MDKRIRQAFDQIQAGEALKEQTSAYLEQVRARGRSSAVRPWLAAAVACLVLMIAGIGGYQVYFTPTSVLSIEINPSVELGINRFDKVVTVQGYNEDGQALADSLDLRFLDYQQALEQLIASQSIANRLEQGEILSITVVGEDASQSSRLLAGARACTAGQENIQCGHGDVQILEEAHHAGLSMGKYQAFLALQALDPTVTPEAVYGLSMGEIQDWIARLEEKADSTAQTGQAGQTTHGNGQGHRHGWETHE